MPGSIPDWRREGDTLVREMRFRDFDDALHFVERIAQRAVDHFRRPDMCISDFNHVRLVIVNRHHAGITLAEERLAEKVDEAILAGTPEAA